MQEYKSDEKTLDIQAMYTEASPSTCRPKISGSLYNNGNMSTEMPFSESIQHLFFKEFFHCRTLIIANKG